jgi:hypothetical protein
MFRVNKFTEMAWNFLCSEAASELGPGNDEANTPRPNPDCGAAPATKPAATEFLPVQQLRHQQCLPVRGTDPLSIRDERFAQGDALPWQRSRAR